MPVSITSITPSTGANKGGSFTTAIGTGFESTQNSGKVEYGTTLVTEIVFWSDTKIEWIQPDLKLSILDGQVVQAVTVKITNDSAEDDTTAFSAQQKESVRERILEVIKTAIENIVRVEHAIPNSANTGPAFIESGGDVNLPTGLDPTTETKTYTIEVTTGGGTGVAEITITDVVGTVVVTDLKKIGLALSGAWIQFNFTEAKGDLVSGDKFTVRVGPYHNTIKRAIRFTFDGNSIKEYPSVIIMEPTEDSNANTNPLKMHTMNLSLMVWDEDFDDDASMSTRISRLYQDVIRKLQKDFSLDCLSVQILDIGSESFTGPEGEGLGGVIIKTQVQYRFIFGDPTTRIGSSTV